MAMVLLGGCATVSTSSVLKDPFEDVPVLYAKRAQDYEAKGQLRDAIRCWKVVSAFHPDVQQTIERIKSLEMIVTRKGKGHYEQGVSYYEKGMMNQARREFILCLSYTPDNKEAVEYLQNKIRETIFTLYETKPGDTLSAIAQETYQNQTNDFLIAYFNHLDRRTELKTGQKLKLPLAEIIPSREHARESVPEGEPDTREGIDCNQLMVKAVNLFQTGEYKAAISMARKVRDYDVTNKSALQFFDQLEEEAEKHYRMGVNSFINENIKDSIREWEITLLLNPEHEKAQINIEKARNLLIKLEHFK